MYRRPTPRFHDARRFRVPSRKLPGTRAEATTTFFEQRTREEGTLQECPTCLERKGDEDLIRITEVSFWEHQRLPNGLGHVGGSIPEVGCFRTRAQYGANYSRFRYEGITSSKEPISLNALCSFKHFEEPKVPGVLSEGQTAVGS
jgi:hypothetical protein